MINAHIVDLQRKRVKYAWIYVNYKLEVKVVIPMRFKDAQVAAFLQAKAPWVEKKLEHYRRLQESAPQHEAGTLIYFDKAVRVDLDTNNISAVEKWYKIEAKKYFPVRVAELASFYGFTYGRISVRDAKTRWGSCSPKKNLSFNWRLMKAPEFVVDYLILHELAHTVVLNHSRKFWQLVAQVCPRYIEAKAWLKANGPRL